MSSKTLVILSPGFPENEADSTCLPAQQALVKALNDNFPALNIIILAFEYPFISSTYQWYSNKVISIGGKNRRKLYRLHTWWKTWRQLKKIRTENEVIGIFSFWCGDCALLGKYFSKAHNIKHFTWILGQDARPTNNMIRYIRPSPQSLVTISDFLVQEFKRSHNILPAHVIPIAVDVTDFSPATVPVDIDILGAGSLIPLKQYEIFIEIISALKEYYPDIKAGICGKGPEEEKLQLLIEQHQLQNNMQLYGEKPHNEVMQFMQRSRILLHPSSYEGFGLVMLEALYAGAQVVSFCRPMIADIPHWYIVKDKEAMLQQILELLQQPAINRDQVLPFDINKSAKSIMALFDYSEAITS